MEVHHDEMQGKLCDVSFTLHLIKLILLLIGLGKCNIVTGCIRVDLERGTKNDVLNASKGLPKNS